MAPIILGMRKYLSFFSITLATALTAALATPIAVAQEDSNAESTVVLTSYGPFSRSHNSSGEVAQKTKDLLEQDGVKVIYREIATDWTTFASDLNSLVKANNPDAIISLGESALIPYPTVELLGQNHREGIDANGNSGSGEVVKGGEFEKFAPAENKEAQKATKEAGHLIRASHNAGLYLCNAALYTNLGFLEAGLVRHAGFVHVPARDKGAAELGQDAETVAAFVKNLVK